MGFVGEGIELQKKNLNFFFKHWKKIILFFLAFLGTLFFTISSITKSSDIYKASVEKAKANQEIVNLIGAPISEGFLPMGSIKTSGSNGRARFLINLEGPNGKGALSLEAVKEAGAWKYQTLMFKSRDQSIDLLVQ